LILQFGDFLFPILDCFGKIAIWVGNVWIARIHMGLQKLDLLLSVLDFFGGCHDVVLVWFFLSRGNSLLTASLSHLSLGVKKYFRFFLKVVGPVGIEPTAKEL